MALLETTVCEFGKPAPDFALRGVDGRTWSLADCRGPTGTLVMFICNHCPYVKAIQIRLARDTRELLEHGVRSVAIMPNDTHAYPEDGFENMVKVAARFQYAFPYLLDETQAVARAYGAICTPDFFGYNADLKLQYRGRLDASRMQEAAPGAARDLFDALCEIARTGSGPAQQIPSVGCSIKWREPG
jgi:peroxiredoxin